MEKYRISPDELKGLFKKLIASGLMTQEEFAELQLLWAQQDGEVWRCPACHMPQSREFPECPQCGIIVSKFMAKMHPEEATPQASGFIEVPPSDPEETRASGTAPHEDLPSGSTPDHRCAACQSTLLPNAKFCNSCGARVA